MSTIKILDQRNILLDTNITNTLISNNSSDDDDIIDIIKKKIKPKKKAKIRKKRKKQANVKDSKIKINTEDSKVKINTEDSKVKINTKDSKVKINTGFNITRNRMDNVFSVMSKQREESKIDKQIRIFPKNIRGVVACVNYIKPAKLLKIPIYNINQFLRDELPFAKTSGTQDKKQMVKEHEYIRQAVLRCVNSPNSFITYKSGLLYKGPYQKYIEIKRGRK